MELPDRAAAARIDGNAAAEATGIVVTLTGNSRDRGANGSSRQLWGGSQSAMASTVPPSAAAATGTEAASGAIRHSPRTLHQQRLPAGTAATNAALASARRRVLVKQQQLLDYLDCISAGERLLREIQQQQQCPKRPTALSRLTGVLPQQQQHPEELRQQREQELMRLLWGRSEVQTKQKQEPVSKRQQKQQQRLKGTKRQLPTSALQRLFFRLQRKMKQLELVQDRQSAAQQLGKDPAKLRSLPRERKQEQQHREQQQQGQKLQECQQQLQNEQQNPLEQPQPPQQQQHHQLQQKGWRQQQQQMTWGFAQHQQELLQRGFGGCTFLTACEDTGGQPVSAAAAAAPANAHAAHRANLADFSPASVGVAASASVVLPAASAAQKCAGIAPPPPVVDAIKDVAAAARLARPAAADHTQLARDATNVPTAAIAIAALNAVSTPVNASGAPTNAATPPVHLLEGPTQSATGSCFSSRNNSRKCLLQQQTKGQQPQQQDLCMRLLDGQIEVAAAPHSLATARRQQLQQLVASRTETLVHIGVVLASAAARCDKLTAAREAFKEHVRSNGPRLRRNVINGQASNKSLRVYKHRAAAATRKAEKLQVEEETAAAIEEQLQREAEALLPYKENRAEPSRPCKFQEPGIARRGGALGNT
ncbi:hypothetical protein, conserved [Eimeria acervulina]|uniref:Uncharacterized protein n=1 Tax=Eimeria acervulina TaxID=5801 RepID=U6GV35_EIMAC|nr:hypothetical protein, conserved [Eimeria acervulina]CDI82439.1 hypothetical protein, conserved [Eimeria acervulina]